MTRRLLTLLLLLLLCAGHRSDAGILAVESGAGLPDKYITAISKDARGLMWIGTRQGLCMYDGYRFLPLRGMLQSGVLINRLLYDGRGDILWATTDKGLFAVHCNQLRVDSITHSGGGMLTDACLASDNLLYASYRNGDIMVIGRDLSAKLAARLPAEEGKAIYAGTMERSGSETLSLQVSGRYAFYTLNTKTQALSRQPVDHSGPPAYFKKYTGDLEFEIREGELEMNSAAAEVTPYMAATGLLKHISNVVTVEVMSPGVLYVLAKPSVLYRIDLVNGRKDTIASEVFTGRLFTSFFFDSDGIIWIGSNKGLIKITQDRQLFSRLLLRRPLVSVRCIAEDDRGTLYAGTYSGLFVSHDRGENWAAISTQIFYALLDRPGPYLYLAGGDKSFYRLDKNTETVETGFFKTEGLPQDGLGQTSLLAEDNDSLLWIGGTNGLAFFDPRSSIVTGRRDVKGLSPGARIIFIKPRSNGKIFLCTNNGLLELDKQQGITWQLNTQTQPALSGDQVNYVSEDSDGRLWICTAGNGLDIVSADRKKVTTLKTGDGLSDNETYHLLWQNPHRAWISTFNGLSSYSRHSGTFYNFYADDGLTINEFNHSAFFRDHTGRMYFGTINGINAFYPDSISIPDNRVRLFVSGITKWDSRAAGFIDLPPADTNSPIIIHPLDHSLNLTLALANYHNPDAAIFRYRIKGLFDDWVTLHGQQALRIDGLAAGSYTLEIMALSSRGTPAANTLSYRIEVRQAIYKSWWFYLGLFLLTSGLLWGFFYLRLQNVRKVQHLREQIASDLHDEVGSLLTRITMTSDNLRYSSQAEADKTSKLEKIAALSRTAASSMSDILWSIDARNDYTGNLADRMREHAEEMLLPLNIEVHFEFNVNQRLSIPSQLRQQLYLIFKEAINNIVKHSKATEVKIGYHHTDPDFRLSIVNNGYVRKEKSSTKGQGLKNIQMRAGRVKANVNFETRDDTFLVTISGR